MLVSRLGHDIFTAHPCVQVIEFRKMTQTLRRLLHEEPSLQTCEASIRQHEDELRSTGFVLPPFGECEEEACPDEHRPKFFFDPDWFERVHRKLTVYGVEMIVNGVHYKRIFWSDLTQRHVLVDMKYVEALNKAVSSLFHKQRVTVIAVAYIDRHPNDEHELHHEHDEHDEHGIGTDINAAWLRTQLYATKCSVNIQIDVDEEQDEEDDIFTENDEDDAVVADLNRMDNWIRFPRCCSYLDMKDHEYDELDPLYRCIFVENFDEPDPVIIQLHLMLTNERYRHLRNNLDMYSIHMLIRDLNAERCHNTEYWQHWQYHWDSWMKDNLL